MLLCLCPYFLFYMSYFCRCCCQAHNFKVLSVLVCHNSMSCSPFPTPFPTFQAAVFVLFVYLHLSFLVCPKQIFILSEFIISLCSFITVLSFTDLLKYKFFYETVCFIRYLVHSLRDSSIHMKDFPIPC